MLREEFETWLADFFLNTTLITVGMHVTNLGYLKDGPPCFTELPNDSMEESNRILVGLDIATIIPKTDNQDLSDLIDLEVKRANKKKEKAERCQQRKIHLAQATMAGDALLSLVASAYCLPLSFIASTSNIGGISTSGTGDLSGNSAPSSRVADGSLLSAILGYFLSLVTSGSPLSAISSCSLSLVASGGLLSACLLFLVIFCHLLLMVALCLLFLIVVFCLLCLLLALGHFF